MKNFTLFLLVAMSLPALTQNLELKHTYVLSGGVYSDPSDHVAVGYFEPGEDEYHVFDSVYTQSAQDVIAGSNRLFVAAGDSLVSYDLQTHERLATTAHAGLNKIAVAGEKLLVTRQYPVTTESLLILDKQTLETSSVISLSGEAAGILIEGDTAYIAVPGAWGTPEGRMAVIDLSNESLAYEVNLGADAQGTKEVFYRNNQVFTVNTHFSDYENNTFSVTSYEIYTGNFETTIIEGDYYGYYGNSVMADTDIIIPLSSALARYNTASQEIQLDFMSENPAALSFDVSSGQLHLTRSDYTTYGEYQIYNLEGDPATDAMPCGVSPEAMCQSYDITNEFLAEDVLFWVGEGSKEALLVIDWNDENYPESMAWGYRFEATVDAETMLLEIAEADASLEVETAGGFLNDILYNGTSIAHSGIGGMPDYWSTWNRTAESLWEMNMGISMDLSHGARFGCSYGFDPEPEAPDVPTAAPLTSASVDYVTGVRVNVWLTDSFLQFKANNRIKLVEVFNASGQLITSKVGIDARRGSVTLRKLSAGLLVVRIHTENEIITKKILR